MKGHFLFIGYLLWLLHKRIDLIQKRNVDVYYSSLIEKSNYLHDDAGIDAIILTLHKLRKTAFLKYIRQYYPAVKLLNSAREEHYKTIHAFN
jgi:hypothetical protein